MGEHCTPEPKYVSQFLSVLVLDYFSNLGHFLSSYPITINESFLYSLSVLPGSQNLVVGGRT